jgi:hypothetical protein
MKNYLNNTHGIGKIKYKIIACYVKKFENLALNYNRES